MHTSRFPLSLSARAARAFVLTAGLAAATVVAAQGKPDLRRTRLICDAPLGLCLATYELVRGARRRPLPATVGGIIAIPFMYLGMLATSYQFLG